MKCKNTGSYLTHTSEDENEAPVFLKEHCNLVYISGFHPWVIPHPTPWEY